jgi:hypothetical protein
MREKGEQNFGNSKGNALSLDDSPNSIQSDVISYNAWV